MRMTRRNLLVAGGTGTLSMLFGSRAWAQAATTLRLGHVVATTHPQHLWCEKFADIVDRQSNGQLKVEIFPNAQLGEERQIVEGVQLGTIDMVNAGAGTTFNSFVPSLAAFDTPFIFRDYEHLYAVQDGPIADQFAAKLAEKGFILVGWSDIGWRHFTSNSRPYRTPADMKGLKVRVPPSPMYIEMIKAIGANPVPVPYNELYLALQQGLADGEENAASSVRAGKFYEVQKYLSLDGHVLVTCVVAMSARTYGRLSRDQQKIVRAAGREATKLTRPIVQAYERESYDFLKKQGMQLVEVDRAAFVDATKDVPEKMKATIPLDLVKQIRDTK